jgi:PAS domain S-box-containing protein
MRIKTQFIIIMLLFGIILAVIAASAIITHQKLEKASQQEKLAANIAQGASELSYLSNDYLIYRESQQLKRWQSRFATLSNQVASLHVDKPEQQVLVHNIRANEQRLKQVFDSVASAVGDPSQNRSTSPDLAFLQVSWSRMAVQNQGLVSDASRLSQLLHQQMDQLIDTRTVLMYIMLGLFGAFLLASYMLTYRNILKSIVTLQAGAAVIGSGNLDFIIEEKRNDEIGDLSRAFNQMTANLKGVTASKSDLEREIIERKKAEEELGQQREWLRVTLSSIGDAVIASDTEGRITFLNPVAVTLTGWQTEETLGQPIQGVFRIINEKTHMSAEDLVARVLTEKCVVGLANDTALVTKDGREVPIEDSAAPILDAAGNLIGVVLVFHDVTEKRRAQAALREALERAVWLARFPDENPNPVVRASADGSVLYCNQASVEVHGWACRVGKPLQDPLLPLVGHAMTEGQEAQQDVELGGKFYFVSVTPFPEEGYVNVYGRDITERKRTEEALQQRTLELQQLTDTLEQQVQERTEELEAANEELRNQIDECARIEIKLKKSESSLRQLSVELLNAQEKERKMVAGEIHDSIGSSLSAVKFKVETALTELADRSPQTTTALKSLVPIVQGAIDEARRIQMNLRPSTLDDLGLLATIRWLCRQFESTYSAIGVKQSIKIEEHEVPDSLKTVIFRVLQEGLNNIAKHSMAKVVLLFLRKAGQGVQLVIQDNGQGFDLSKAQSPEGATQGLGLRSMRERTELSGGSFEIESTQGKGTIVRASWPI